MGGEAQTNTSARKRGTVVGFAVVSDLCGGCDPAVRLILSSLFSGPGPRILSDCTLSRSMWFPNFQQLGRTNKQQLEQKK